MRCIFCYILLGFACIHTFFFGAEVDSLKLQPGHWAPETRDALEELINAEKESGRVVVIDFDNTMIAGDIEHALVTYLLEKDLITPSKKLSLRQAMQKPAKKVLHLTEYHWPIQDMWSLSLANLLDATEQAYLRAQEGYCYYSNITDTSQLIGQFKVPQPPLFYNEMVNLVALLKEAQYDVWILSASNVWSVRWMITEVLNPMLEERYALPANAIPADHVIGLSVLLHSPDQQLYKDRYLLQDTSPLALKYQENDPLFLRQLSLTRQLTFPIPAYTGKVVTVQTTIPSDEPPYLAIGDSLHDLPLLHFADHALWIARLEDTDAQKLFSEKINTDSEKDERFLIQTVLHHHSPGFVKSESQLYQRLHHNPTKLHATLHSLTYLRQLPSHKNLLKAPSHPATTP